RPISIHDAKPGTIAFLYQVRGIGTLALSRLRSGDEVQLDGPYGNGFPLDRPAGRVALVGGGIGAAPLLYAAKRLGSPAIYLGFSLAPLRLDAYEQAASRLVVREGGTIADDIDPAAYDTLFACGPNGLLRALYDKTKQAGTRLYVSVEKRMACGIGACLGCTVEAGGRQVRACCEGPVFDASEVNFDALDEL